MAGVFYSTLLVFVVATVVFFWVLRQLRKQDQERSRK
jgi:preprotein translocase subunit YajC